MSRSDDQNQLEGVEKSPAFLLHREGYTIDDYRLIARIGEGSFGEVWKAERGGFEVALKILKTSLSSDETQRELKSLETLKKLHHKFLLHTDNFWSDGDRLFIEMELAEGGTLKERLKAYQSTGKPGIPADELLKYFTETAKALDYLHSHRPVFLHRDIKPANILLVKGCAKLADFGLLRQVAGDNSSTKTQGGTFPYMACESIASDVFSIYTDLFSFAVTYAELRQGELPFPGKNQYQICEKILKSAPELGDIFDPEEKKVLLKALDKEPHRRFSSCGEFVFELNRVVPWVPAVDVPIYIPGLPAPPFTDRGIVLGSEAKSTDQQPPRAGEQGTTRKRNSAPATMPDYEMPGSALPSAGAPTVSKDDGTVHSDRGKRSPKPAVEHPTKTRGTDIPTKAGSPPASTPPPPTKASFETERKDARPSLAPTPPRPVKRGKGGLVLVVAAMFVAIATGAWFVLNLSAKDEVRELLEKDQFADAMLAIKETNRLVLPNPESLQKEVEDKWSAELNKKDGKDDLKALNDMVDAIKAFKKHFPNNTSVKARYDSALAKITEIETQPPIGPEKPAPTDAFAVHLAKAKTMLTDRRFDASWSSLVEAKKAAKSTAETRKLAARFLELRDALIQDVRSDYPIPANAASVLKKLKQLDRFKNDLDFGWTEDVLASLEADESLALAYQKQTDRALEFYVKLLKMGKNSLVQDHTLFFLGRIPADSDMTARAAKLVPETKELSVLVFLAHAYQGDPEKQREAVVGLIQCLSDKELFAGLRSAVWPALAKVHEKARLLRFTDLDVLEKALPPMPIEVGIKKANAAILASVLESQVRKDNYQWRPSPEDQPKILAWCERVDAPSQAILALKVECMAETGAPIAKFEQVTFPLKEAGWYGSYAEALAVEKQAGASKAASVLVAAFKGKAEVKPVERSARAVGMLRAAVGTLERKGKDAKEFTRESDAKNAILWLDLAFELNDASGDEKAVDDLVNLAFAAVKSAAVSRLSDAGKRLEAGKYPNAAKIRGHYFLAKAHMAEGKSESAAIANFQKALKVPGAGKDELRMKVASEAASYALQLAKTDAAKSDWTRAIEHSGLCQDFAYQLKNADLQSAAQLNVSAVDIEVQATLKQSDEAKKGKEVARVFDRVIQKASVEDAFVAPVIVSKLGFSRDKHFPRTKIYLDDAIAEGKAALKSALAQEKAGNTEKEWWRIVRRMGMVNLADARTVLLNLNELNAEIVSKDSFRTECEEILGLYEKARQEKYIERWNGELSFRVGQTLIYLGLATKEIDVFKRAVRELTDAINSSRMEPAQPYSREVQVEVREAQTLMEQALAALKKNLEKQ